MYILGLESSCDETACAVIFADPEHRLFVKSNVIASQVEIHNRFGGIVPEIASRQHILRIVPTVAEALDRAGLELAQLDGIAVTNGPGLVGALLIAVQVAKAISYSCQVPLIGVHHLEGHLLATYLNERKDLPLEVPSFPYLALLASGGHTSLIYVKDFGTYQVLGSTRDDAAGEAFDKVGKMLGLGYPAGPEIDRLSEVGSVNTLPLTKAMLGPKGGLDFSFSGLKTQVAYHIKRESFPLEAQQIADVCASFQAAVVEQLVRKTSLALDQLPAQGLVLAGGVACNRAVRHALAELCRSKRVKYFVPPPHFCTDNAAMIAAAGYHRLQRGQRSDYMLNATASLPL